MLSCLPVRTFLTVHQGEQSPCKEPMNLFEDDFFCHLCWAARGSASCPSLLGHGGACGMALVGCGSLLAWPVGAPECAFRRALRADRMEPCFCWVESWGSANKGSLRGRSSRASQQVRARYSHKEKDVTLYQKKCHICTVKQEVFRNMEGQNLRAI